MSTLNQAMGDFVEFLNDHIDPLKEIQNNVIETQQAHEDIQDDRATELADQIMTIIGYDEDRPEIEDKIKDVIYDNWNLETR